MSGREVLGDPPTRNEAAADVLEALSSFMAEVAAIEDVQALCMAAARTLREVSGRTWLVHLFEHDREGAMAWRAVANAGAGERWRVAGASPQLAHVGPRWGSGQHRASEWVVYEALEAGRLGLEGPRAVPQIEIFWIASGASVGLMFGAICDDGSLAALSPAVRGLAKLVAQHLAAAATAVQVDSLRRDTELRYRTLVEQIPAVIYHRRVDTVAAPLFVSPQVEAMLGYPPDYFLAGHSKFAEILHPDDRERVLRGQRETIRSRELLTSEYRLIHRDGHTVWVSNRTLAVPGRDGQSRVRIGVLFDVTEIKRLELQYHHAQKMEAVGRLASGIAHDFNNVLGVILSYAGMVEAELEPESRLREDVEAIVDGVERGQALVAQLLSFGRPKAPERRPLDLGEVLDAMRSMLGPVLGAGVQVELERDPELGRILADRSQLEQVLMNLLVNARDAMPEGGRLRMGVRNLNLSEGLNTNYEIVRPGDYVVLEIEDSGLGMDDATRERLFEPFFTTKDKGKGTGLGMAMVLGIVRKHGGAIGIDSAPGRGTMVRLYFPRVRGSA